MLILGWGEYLDGRERGSDSEEKNLRNNLIFHVFYNIFRGSNWESLIMCKERVTLKEGINIKCWSMYLRKEPHEKSKYKWKFNI